jgi:hypothetical protein
MSAAEPNGRRRIGAHSKRRLSPKVALADPEQVRAVKRDAKSCDRLLEELSWHHDGRDKDPPAVPPSRMPAHVSAKQTRIDFIPQRDPMGGHGAADADFWLD